MSVFGFETYHLKSTLRKAMAETEQQRPGQGGLVLQNASEKLKNKPDIVLEAINYTAAAYGIAGINIRNDPGFLEKAVQKNPDVVKYVTDDQWRDPKLRPILIRAIIKNNDPSRLIAVINANPRVIMFLDREQWKDPRFDIILLAAINKSEVFNKALPDSFITQSLIPILLEILRDHPDRFRLMPDALKNNPNFLLQMLHDRPESFSYIPGVLKNNSNFLLQMLHDRPESFSYIPGVLKNNSNFLLKVVLQQPEVFQLFPSIFKNNPRFMREAIDKNPQVIMFTNQDQWGNPRIEGILLETLHDHPERIRYMPGQLKDNPDFVERAIAANHQIGEFLQKELRLGLQQADIPMVKNPLSEKVAFEKLMTDLTRDLTITIDVVDSFNRESVIRDNGEALRKCLQEKIPDPEKRLMAIKLAGQFGSDPATTLWWINRVQPKEPTLLPMQSREMQKKKTRITTTGNDLILSGDMDIGFWDTDHQTGQQPEIVKTAKITYEYNLTTNSLRIYER